MNPMRARFPYLIHYVLGHTLKCKQPRLCSVVVGIVHKMYINCNVVHTMLINSDVCGQKALKMAGSKEVFVHYS